MLRLTSSFVLLFLIHNSLCDPNAPCYFPSGDRALGYFPCDANAYIVQCCPTGWTCYSNSLCVITDPSTANATAPIGTSIRGTCTDPKWVNPICGEYCLDEKTTDAIVEPCGGNAFCCESDQKAGTCNCSNGNGIFTLGTGLVQTIIGVQGLSYTTTATISAGKTVGATTLSTTTTGSATASATSTAPTNKGLSTGAKIGIGVGAGVGGFAILVGALMLCMRYVKKKNEIEDETPKVAPVPQMGFPHQPQEMTDADTNRPYGRDSDNASL